MKFIALAAILLGGGFASAEANEVRPGYGGLLRVPLPGAEFHPRLYVVKSGVWQLREAGGGDHAEKNGSRRFFLRTDNGPSSDVDGSFVLSECRGDVSVKWSFVPQKNAKAVASEVRGVLPLEFYSGGAFVADGARTEIPVTAPKNHLLDKNVRRFELYDVQGAKRLEISFPAPQKLGVVISGDPKIGGKLILCLRASGMMKAGEDYVVGMTLRVPGGLTIGPDSNFRIKGGDEWVPFAGEKDIKIGSALDFSSFRATGVPAGRNGRVISVEDHFEFERSPGVPVRFYGVNICAGAVTPDTPEVAKSFARRLAMSGYNAVRIHHHETYLVTSKAQEDPLGRDGVTLNPRQMRKFDSFVAACVENGLYLTTDLFCSRNWAIRWRDVGIDRDGRMGMSDFKNLVQVHEGVYSNYLAFARSFLGHTNEFTGRTLAEEPALAWISLVNEGCLGRSTATLEQWAEWRNAWKRWLGMRRRENPRDYGDIPEAFPADVMVASRHACAFKLFLADTESAFAAKVRRFLRHEMKCKALLTNMNGVFHPIHTREARQKNYDYIDGHFYVDHPNFLGQNWKPPSSAGTSNPLLNVCGANYPSIDRDYSRPFTVTEWNYCAPNPNRGCAGLLVGAAAVIQGWGGLWHFDFAGGQEQYVNPEHAAMGPFTMAGDPLMRASDRTAMMLYLRGDMKPVKKSFAVEIPEDVFRRPVDALPSENTWHWLNWITWYGRLGTSIVPTGGALPGGLVRLAKYPDDYVRKDYDTVFRTVTGSMPDAVPAKTMPPAADGQVRVDGSRGTFFVDTPRTCGGFAPSGAFEVGVLRADVGTIAASVSASSLDGRPISGSDRILVTHLTDTVNTGITFTDESRRILSDWGVAPQLVRKAKVPLSLAVRNGKWTVWAIDMDGSRVRVIPSTWTNGRLSFVCDTAANPRQATFHYELTRSDRSPLERFIAWLRRR